MRTGFWRVERLGGRTAGRITVTQLPSVPAGQAALPTAPSATTQGLDRVHMIVTGNTVLVTGGGSGIGRGLAEALLARGNTVIIAGRRESALAATVAANPGMKSVVLDVADPVSIKAVTGQLIADYPSLNTLINAAGVAQRDDPTDRIDDTVLTGTIATNFYGPIRMASALLEHFKRQPRAALVHVSSTLGYLPHSGLAIYSASKAALHSYVLSQRYRLRGTSVSVIEIAPPMVATALDTNADNPRAMPLSAYIAETMAELESGADEALVASARARRDGLLNDEPGAMIRLNDMLLGSD